MTRENDWHWDESPDLRKPKDIRWLVYYIIGLCVIAIALIAAGRAEAAEVKLTCKPPTQYTNNSPIAAPLTYKAYWGTSATSLTNTLPLAGPGCAGPVIVPDPAPGASATYHFAVTATAAGVESDKSNIATKTVTTPLPTPSPPILLTTGGIVYQASPDWVKFSFKLGAQVGSISDGIKCDCSRKIGDDYCRVTGPIVWTAGKKDYVVTRCEAV